MEMVELGNSDIEVSKIGIGTWQAAAEEWGEDVDITEGEKAIIRAFEMGVNFIDTAEIYGDGDSEKVVGSALEKIDRDDVIVATKVAKHLRYEDVKRACKESLERLGIDQIDLYQVHWPVSQIPLKHTMEAMEELYHEGKIRAIGVSNFAARDLEEAREVLSDAEIISNQVRYNMVQRQIEEEVFPYCRENDITVIAYSPLAKGLLTGKYGPDNKPSDDVRKERTLFKDRNLEEISNLLYAMEEISEKRDKKVSQVALNWIIKKPDIVPIPGAKNLQQAEWNAGAAGWELTDEEENRLNEEIEKLDLDYF